MIIRRPVMRFKLASILAKMMNLPAPQEESQVEVAGDEPQSEEA